MVFTSSRTMPRSLRPGRIDMLSISEGFVVKRDLKCVFPAWARLLFAQRGSHSLCRVREIYSHGGCWLKSPIRQKFEEVCFIISKDLFSSSRLCWSNSWGL